MNSVKLIGNVGREINVKEFEGGKMLTFSLATDEGYVNKTKEEVKNKARISFGSHYPALQKIKTKYDPENIFNPWLSITPA